MEQEPVNRSRERDYRVAQSGRRFILVVSSILLLTIVYMAVPRVPNQGAAYFAKQIYYNHGEGRGPHLGQRPHMTDLGSQTNSRRLLAQADFPDNGRPQHGPAF